MVKCHCISITFGYLGNALFYGLSIMNDLDTIKSMLGVCPQHDVLWEELTAREHMLLFAQLKDIAPQQMEDEMNRLLDAVQLSHVSSVEVLGVREVWR